MTSQLPRTGEIDPQIERFMSFLAVQSALYPAANSLPFSERRRIAEELRLPLTEGGPSLRNTVDHVVRNGETRLKVRVMNAGSGDRQPALIYLHGGGWMLFSINTHNRIMRELAARAGIAVIGIDYSLSPDVRYPTQLMEIQAVISWVRRNGNELGIDPDRLAIGGDSAGANLSIATCLKLRQAQGLAAIRGMLLCYGVYDARFDTQSYLRYADPAYVLSRDEMLDFWANYVRGPDDYDDPLVSPLRAELTGLPPTLMIIAERDVLYDENIDMVKKLSAAGVDVDSKVYKGTIHSFLEAMSMAEVSRRALGDAATWLRRRLEPA